MALHLRWRPRRPLKSHRPCFEQYKSYGSRVSRGRSSSSMSILHSTIVKSRGRSELTSSGSTWMKSSRYAFATPCEINWFQISYPNEIRFSSSRVEKKKFFYKPVSTVLCILELLYRVNRIIPSREYVRRFKSSMFKWFYN